MRLENIRRESKLNYAKEYVFKWWLEHVGELRLWEWVVRMVCGNVLEDIETIIGQTSKKTFTLECYSLKMGL
ncbi:MAG: hypothetical protein N3D14_04170 [Aquificaceae bacterium]|nr:hypothetical protein [Aquificaceae bacterium]